jgi:hypothetical protein
METVSGIFLEDKIYLSNNSGTIISFSALNGKVFKYDEFPTCFIVRVADQGVLAVFSDCKNTFVRLGQASFQTKTKDGVVFSVVRPDGSVVANTAELRGVWTHEEDGQVPVYQTDFVKIRTHPTYGALRG